MQSVFRGSLGRSAYEQAKRCEREGRAAAIVQLAWRQRGFCRLAQQAVEARKQELREEKAARVLQKAWRRLCWLRMMSAHPGILLKKQPKFTSSRIPLSLSTLGDVPRKLPPRMVPRMAPLAPLAAIGSTSADSLGDASSAPS